MQLIHFKGDTCCTYPVGASFNRNRDYIVEVARTIHTITGKERCISLICRGTSMYYVTKQERKIIINLYDVS